MKIRTLGFLALAAAFVSEPAAAQTYTWTGFYLGGAAGYRSADVKATPATNVENFIGPIVQNNVTVCPLVATCSTVSDYGSSSGRFGVFGGYNFMVAPNWIAGVEGDWNWGHSSRTAFGRISPLTLATVNASNSYSVKSGWEASLRGRAGYLLTPRTLIYATGGIAFARLETNSTCDTSAVGICQPGEFTPANISQSRVVTGLTLGVGGETKITPNLLARLDYRYADYGKWSPTETRNCTPTPSAQCGTAVNIITTQDISLRTHAVTVGLAYMFGTP